MTRKIALKRLSSSDLTLFEHHYRNTTGAKQKGINLDSAVFIKSFFPVLPNKLNPIKNRAILTLTIFGPGTAGSHVITRKVLKQQKNWRLNGELISNPPEEPGRYDQLVKGDYAILDFSGDEEPHAVKLYITCQNLDADKALHDALESEYGGYFSNRTGMIELDPESLTGVFEKISLPEGYPVLDFMDSDDLEDAALGGAEGFNKLRKRRKTRGVSREELARARKNADQIGRLGEEVLNTYLEQLHSESDKIDISWTSDHNAVAPYDFTILSEDKEIRRIDAKSTAGDFKNTIHISLSELLEMAEGEQPYDLYRLYSVKEDSARLRVAEDMRDMATNVLSTLQQLPQGISSDGISVKPTFLNFGEEIIVNLSEDDDP